MGSTGNDNARFGSCTSPSSMLHPMPALPAFTSPDKRFSRQTHESAYQGSALSLRLCPKKPIGIGIWLWGNRNEGPLPFISLFALRYPYVFPVGMTIGACQ